MNKITAPFIIGVLAIPLVLTTPPAAMASCVGAYVEFKEGQREMARIVFALTIRPLTDWGWVLASGVIGVLLGIYLFASLPLTATWLLGLLFGIQLLTEGAALTYMTWKIRAA